MEAVEYSLNLMALDLLLLTSQFIISHFSSLLFIFNFKCSKFHCFVFSYRLFLLFHGRHERARGRFR